MGKKPETVRFFVSYSRIFQHMNAHFLAQKWHSFGTVVFGRKQGRGILPLMALRPSAVTG